MYNVHVCGVGGQVWDVSYRLSQLAQLDLLLCQHCGALRDVPFPQIEEETMALLCGKKLYAGKLQELGRYRAQVEGWVWQLLVRAHLLPQALNALVEDWFCLPVGPDSEWVPGRALSTAEMSSLTSVDAPTSLSVSEKLEEKKKEKGLLKFLNVRNTKDPNEKDKKLYENLPVVGLPDQPLLKVRVQRGQIGRNGKVEYDVSYLKYI